MATAGIPRIQLPAGRSDMALSFCRLTSREPPLRQRGNHLPGQLAEHVYTDQASIAQLAKLVKPFPANGQVLLVMRDDRGRQGINATVKLLRPDGSEWSRQVWLDRFVRVEHLDSAFASEC
jgi:hypothetical protein